MNINKFKNKSGRNGRQESYSPFTFLLTGYFLNCIVTNRIFLLPNIYENFSFKMELFKSWFNHRFFLQPYCIMIKNLLCSHFVLIAICHKYCMTNCMTTLHLVMRMIGRNIKGMGISVMKPLKSLRMLLPLGGQMASPREDFDDLVARSEGNNRRRVIRKFIPRFKRFSIGSIVTVGELSLTPIRGNLLSPTNKTEIRNEKVSRRKTRSNWQNLLGRSNYQRNPSNLVKLHLSDIRNNLIVAIKSLVGIYIRCLVGYNRGARFGT